MCVYKNNYKPASSDKISETNLILINKVGNRHIYLNLYVYVKYIYTYTLS